MNEREKKYKNLLKLGSFKAGSINEYKEKFRVIKKELGVK